MSAILSFNITKKKADRVYPVNPAKDVICRLSIAYQL
jgi:hypothetical protein